MGIITFLTEMASHRRVWYASYLKDLSGWKSTVNTHIYVELLTNPFARTVCIFPSIETKECI